MKSEDMVLLTSRVIQSLLTLDECIDAVEHAFRVHGEGKAVAPAVLSMHVKDGGFHVKAGLLELGRPYFATKVRRCCRGLAIRKSSTRWIGCSIRLRSLRKGRK